MGHKIRKGYETRVSYVEFKFHCECGGLMSIRSSIEKKDDMKFTLSCNKCHKSSNASLKFNDYEVVNEF